ncbi:MAG: PadR family transcriptional regulator [Aeromicrobium sp.]
MALTPLAIGALALLNERPMHPYEMYQTLLERHEDLLIKVRPGSLYHTVERLEKSKFVNATGTEREGNRPERTMYAITSAGEEALQSRITEVLTDPVNEYPVFPVGLSESHNLPSKKVVDCLNTYVERLDKQISEIRALLDVARGQNIPEAFWLGGDYIVNIKIAEREWVSTLIDRLASKDLTWPIHP